MSDEHQARLNMMKLKILKLERENLKTQAKTTGAMVEQIRAIIKNEARKICEVKRNAD
ncbi:MAG: hypothetical protein IKE46_10080 [Selenomonadaceae bacterium]|nr:hypothetical protein [Selenomonadaceae bacterium]MBR3745980.1 hypothetical protein [Selenomonadaceae bacterium]